MKGFNERMLSSAERKDSRVVLALDFAGPFETRLGRALRVLDATKDDIAAVKVNNHLILPYGLRGLKGVVTRCRSEGLPIIADLKINDIESTNLNIVNSLLSYGFDAVTANPLVGMQEGLGRVVEELHARGGGILLLVYMSHQGAKEGYGLRTQKGDFLYQLFARRARDWKADGVVVSAKSKQIIDSTRKIVGRDCLIFSPGIGAQGGRVPTARGADFIIIGRAITDAPDPAEALRAFNGA